jgi:hypothetical protein
MRKPAAGGHQQGQEKHICDQCEANMDGMIVVDNMIFEK